MIARLVYDADGVTIWNGDARALPLADGSCHLIVTSPPYNAGIKYDAYHDWLPWEDYWHGLIEPAVTECYWPIMLSTHVWPLLERVGFLPREQLIWLKASREDQITTNSTAWGTFASAQNPVLRATVEPIFIASKNSHSREAGESDITPDEFKAWSRNAWTIPAYLHPNGDHPATFPIELPRRLIKLYSYVGDTVCDPFMGSGTTLWAAKLNGRQAIGVDLSARYCARAADRCSQMLMPLESA
jgi:site-specific DNA-methyltransferase (adenine-specific)